MHHRTMFRVLFPLALSGLSGPAVGQQGTDIFVGRLALNGGRLAVGLGARGCGVRKRRRSRRFGSGGLARGGALLLLRGDEEGELIGRGAKVF